jgi:hypothetical protein
MARGRPQVSAPDMARQQGHRRDRDQAAAAGTGRYKGGGTALPDLNACSEIYLERIVRRLLRLQHSPKPTGRLAALCSQGTDWKSQTSPIMKRRESCPARGKNTYNPFIADAMAS